MAKYMSFAALGPPRRPLHEKHDTMLQHVETAQQAQDTASKAASMHILGAERGAGRAKLAKKRRQMRHRIGTVCRVKSAQSMSAQSMICEWWSVGSDNGWGWRVVVRTNPSLSIIVDR